MKLKEVILSQNYRHLAYWIFSQDWSDLLFLHIEVSLTEKEKKCLHRMLVLKCHTDACIKCLSVC